MAHQPVTWGMSSRRSELPLLPLERRGTKTLLGWDADYMKCCVVQCWTYRVCAGQKSKLGRTGGGGEVLSILGVCAQGTGPPELETQSWAGVTWKIRACDSTYLPMPQDVLLGSAVWLVDHGL